MSRAIHDTLLDQIYEAAVVVEKWPAVLHSLSQIADGVGARLFSQNGVPHRWIGTGHAELIHRTSIESGWHEKNNRDARLFAAQYPGFLGDLDIFANDEIECDPYFAEFLRPRGFGWGVAVVIPVPSGDLIAIDIVRSLGRGPVEREIIVELDELRPHLARAILLSDRLRFEQVRTSSDALDVVGLPAAVLGLDGRLLAANQRFAETTLDLIQNHHGELEINDRRADGLLNQAIGATMSGSGAGKRCSIPIAARNGQPPLILHVLPVRGAARDIFGGAAAFLIAVPVERHAVPSAAIIQGIFNLSPAEARVAQAVADGRTVEQIASSLDLSRETVRSQLKACLSKIGVRRQSELAGLLNGLFLP